MHGPKWLPWLCRAKSEAPSTKRTLPKRSQHRARCRQILCPGFGPKKDKRAQTYYKRRKDHQGEMEALVPRESLQLLWLLPSEAPAKQTSYEARKCCLQAQPQSSKAVPGTGRRAP